MAQTILLIDDDPLFIKAYKTEFESHGYICISTNDGTEGLDLALTKHPDLIILDVMIPGKDGLEILSELRKDAWGQNAPVFVLTNSPTTDDKIAAILKTNPAYFLLKVNITMEELLTKINEFLNNVQR